MKQFFLAAALCFSSLAIAQDLPQKSPKSIFTQRVGLTDIEIEYSRPSAKGRGIFGDLVPYKKLWRTGANKATKITFSTPVNIGGQLVEAGSYSIFTNPNPRVWSVVLNTETELWGTADYNPEMNVAKIEANVIPIPMKVETFTIQVSNIKTGSATLEFMWENTLVSIPLEVDYKTLAEKNIDEAIETSEDDRWRVYRNAANYYFSEGIKTELAIKYCEKSIKSKGDEWYSYYLMSQILASNQEYKKAIQSAEKSIKVGTRASGKAGKEFGYTEMIVTKIESWKKERDK